ncbi:hypothetical protein TRIATDRAFT_256951 [Trichoderma atroviride IMI 206040]|uniref:Uncharacterized protein n=1 Tax=Hypocrea atroviridis (strain ATCC 20476 / IMI 206040) TaxID=452589 RepID=G9NX90_HYPAI|nr:uncharacterized protein TRIATDRAFT_299624 [Trichoderma atroviride IMI 206040]EHK44701.1 hypothetical protein TRIATDRAFT_256951 [Trichoderma atroviride IMI 206040]
MALGFALYTITPLFRHNGESLVCVGWISRRSTLHHTVGFRLLLPSLLGHALSTNGSQ